MDRLQEELKAATYEVGCLEGRLVEARTKVQCIQARIRTLTRQEYARRWLKEESTAAAAKTVADGAAAAAVVKEETSAVAVVAREEMGEEDVGGEAAAEAGAGEEAPEEKRGGEEVAEVVVVGASVASGSGEAAALGGARRGRGKAKAAGGIRGGWARAFCPGCRYNGQPNKTVGAHLWVPPCTRSKRRRVAAEPVDSGSSD